MIHMHNMVHETGLYELATKSQTLLINILFPWPYPYARLLEGEHA